LAVVCAAVAQTGSQSTIVGTVKDGAGAAVPGAKVTVVNTGTQSLFPRARPTQREITTFPTWPGLGAFDQNDQVLQTTQDALEEVKVITSGMSAEFGHAASGGMQLTFKSGANQVHFSGEDRMIRTSWVHRSYFQQTPQQPFRFDDA
jgi:hypothetical protein